MNGEHMMNLTIKPLANGGFELSQQTGLEDPAAIELHPCQVRLLAERAGLLTPDPTARMSARHMRRIRFLRDRIKQLEDVYRDEIIDRCGAGIEICLHMEAIADLACELVEDCSSVAPAATVTAALPEAVTECHEKSAAISVTPRRGRPRKENKLTDAERQAKHRAKQAELLPLNPPDAIDGDNAREAAR